MFQSTSSSHGLQLKIGAKQKLFIVPAAALALFALTFLAVPYITSSLKASAASIATTQIAANVTEAWATLTTSGDVSMNAGIVADDVVIVQDALAVARTNSPAGYQLYLTGKNGTTSSASTLVNTANETVTIDSVSTTTASALTSNTWGYAAVGDDVATGVFSADYAVGSFSNSDAKFNNLFKGIVATGADLNDRPKSITALGEDASDRASALIASSNHANVDGARTRVYYAARISPNTPSGTYANEVTYTLFADCKGTTDPDPYTPPANGEDDYAYTDNGKIYYYDTAYNRSNTGAHRVYYIDETTHEKVTAYGVNKNITDAASTTAKVANISDGNITWAAVAVVAGASATFLAIALLRDREDEDDEEGV